MSGRHLLLVDTVEEDVRAIEGIYEALELRQLYDSPLRRFLDFVRDLA